MALKVKFHSKTHVISCFRETVSVFSERQWTVRMILPGTFRVRPISSPEPVGFWSSVTEHLPLWGPFLEGPEKFSHLESRSKISNLMITELVYSHILNMNTGFFFIQEVSGVYTSVFLVNGFAGPKSFRAFRETGPGQKQNRNQISSVSMWPSSFERAWREREQALWWLTLRFGPEVSIFIGDQKRNWRCRQCPEHMKL